MPKMIQIRNVPDDLHRTLKTKAAERGMTLSDYLLEMAERVSWTEMSERIGKRGRVRLGTSAADIIREHRGPLPPLPMARFTPPSSSSAFLTLVFGRVTVLPATRSVQADLHLSANLYAG